MSFAYLQKFPGLGFDICDSGKLLLLDAVEEVDVTSTEDSLAGVAGSGAGGGEPLKARTAACSEADGDFSIASFKDPCTMDCTWVGCGAEKSPSAGDSRSSSILVRHVLTAILNRGRSARKVCLSIRLIRAARPLVVGRLSRLHKDRRSLTYSLLSLRSTGI